jgi:hypothetical protein
VEQQSGAPGAAQAQAARTVLPGEPFDPPQAAQVPGPRAEQAPVAEQLAPPAWNYEQMQAPQAPPAYGAAPATYVDPQQFGDGDFSSLHDYANLPVAPQFGAPSPATEAFAPAAAYPPPAPAEAPAWQPAAQPQAAFPPPVFAPADATALPPLPPVQEDEGIFAEPDKPRSGRKGPDKRLLAVALVAVVAGGGYFGYTQLSKKSSSTTANSPVVPVTAPAPKYDFPSNIAGLQLQPAASSAALRASVLAEAKTWNPAASKTMSFASYASGHPGIIAFSFHPGAAKLAADFSSLVAFSAKPDAGNVAVAPHVAQTGAAGGQMSCGGESGPNAQSWCVWRGTSTIGVLVVEGSPKTQITEILTREMRAYAEH